VHHDYNPVNCHLRNPHQKSAMNLFAHKACNNTSPGNRTKSIELPTTKKVEESTQLLQQL
jgi:hypothetical protein